MYTLGCTFHVLFQFLFLRDSLLGLKKFQMVLVHPVSIVAQQELSVKQSRLKSGVQVGLAIVVQANFNVRAYPA